MAYTWTDGELITAEKLNNTGSGVLIVNDNYDESTEAGILDKTYKEILDAYLSGKIILIKVPGHDGEMYYSVLGTSRAANGNGGQIWIDNGSYRANNDDDYPSSGGGK